MRTPAIFATLSLFAAFAAHPAGAGTVWLGLTPAQPRAPAYATLEFVDAIGEPNAVTVTLVSPTALRVSDESDIEGGIGNDRLIGGGGPDILIGDAGNDRLEGRGGADALSGDSFDGRTTIGDDRLFGGKGRDALSIRQGVITRTAAPTLTRTRFTSSVASALRSSEIAGGRASTPFVPAYRSDALGGGTAAACASRRTPSRGRERVRHFDVERLSCRG